MPLHTMLFEIFLRLWYFLMDFFSLNNTFFNRRQNGVGLPIFMLNLNYHPTQSGRPRDPNLGRDPLFADPCIRDAVIGKFCSYLAC